MTQQYLVGELSLIMGELQAVATNAAAAHDVVRLRRQMSAVARRRFSQFTDDEIHALHAYLKTLPIEATP